MHLTPVSSPLNAFVATCARGTEEALGAELRAERVPVHREEPGAVHFGRTLEDAYVACVWSRVASRILAPIAQVTLAARNAESLYDAAREIRWEDHLTLSQTFAVDCVTRGTRKANTRYLALKVKDAIVDRARERSGRRPDVDPHSPDLRVHVHIDQEEVSFAIDLVGDALHQRGYRPRRAAAPLRETLAAALLHRAGWARARREGGVLVDPMCGSGTLLVEAARMAADIPPSVGRASFAFERWRGHDESAYRRVAHDAEARRRAEPRAQFVLFGSDHDPEAISLARESVRRAGVERFVDLRVGELKEARPPSAAPEGGLRLLVTNPPYGERLGEGIGVYRTYEELGDTMKRRFGGYDAWVLSGNRSLLKRIGLKAAEKHVVWNGALECAFVRYPIRALAPRDDAAIPVGAAEDGASSDEARSAASSDDRGPGWRRPSPEAEMFQNRLRKSLRKIGRWGAREAPGGHRLYDADIPEFNVAVDRFQTDRGTAALVHEYAAPRSVPDKLRERRLRDVMMVVPDILDIAPDDVHLRVRERRRPGSKARQYERRGAQSIERIIKEGGLAFELDLGRYLDTGIFLDLRDLRARIRDEAHGARVLNLFAYTCTASVYAADGGAREVVSVDLNGNYLDWGRRNARRNGVEDQQRFLRADCLRWLREGRDAFDLILLNPPSYSRSKAMDGDFDVQRDHVPLIRDAVRRLSRDGQLYFVTHARRFELNAGALEVFGIQVDEISEQTVPRDFQRSPHRAFVVTRR